MLIEVLPVPNEKKWGVYLDGDLFGTAKNSFDCDFTARILHQTFSRITKDEIILNNHPELR
jgi:hypothetical protein